MNSRNNFLDADNSSMERRLRFVQNDFEDSLNQYFGGSKYDDSHSITSPPPRDYKIVQPRPGRSSSHDFHIEERKAFLRQLGLPRHEAYELAVSTEFDVKHYEKMLRDMFKNGQRAEFINAYISDDIKGLSCDNYDLNYQSNVHNSTDNNVPPPPPRMLNWESDTDIDVDQIPERDEAPTTSKEANKFESANGSEKLSKSKRRKRSHFLRLGFQNEAAQQLAKDGYSKKRARHLGKELNIIPFRIAILPCDYPETLLFTEHMDQIQSNLMTKLSSERNQSTLSTLPITNIVYKAGFMSIDCKNDEAMVKWLLLNVRLIQLGEDIELMAIEERTMPDPFICVGIFKNASNLDAKEILRIVQATNNGLSVKAWRTLKTVITGNATKLVLAVDPKSAEIIQEKNNFVIYKGQRVHLRHQKSLKPYLRSDPCKAQKNSWSKIKKSRPKAAAQKL